MVNQTLGSIADKNAGKFSDDYKEHLRKKHKTKKVGPQMELPKGMEKVEKPDIDVEHVKKLNKINKMTPTQKKKYIDTGKGI